MADGNGIPRRNPEGYNDPTAYSALSAAQAETDAIDARCAQLIKTLKNTIDLAGFDLIARIEVRDRKTGRNYR